MKKKLKKKSKKKESCKPKKMTGSRLTQNPTQKVINALKEVYEFRLNIGNQKMEFRFIGEAKFRNLTDTDFNSIKVELNLNDIPCSRETLRGIIFSNQWLHYDPYKEFLDGLPAWDGIDHIVALAETVTTDNKNYWKWSLKKWLVALVGSLAKEDVVNQTAIIFCGKQGIGKSSWFRNILPPELKDYSSSGFLDPKDKETLVQLSELCLYNMDEVENLKPKNVEAIKELITKPSMYLRRAYTTLSQNYPRRCSFCGTANGIDILHDITGNRRFLCQNVHKMDYELNNIDIYQVYAQAYHLFNSGFPYWLNAQEQAAVEKENSQFRAKSIEEEMIDTFLEPCLDGDKDSKKMQAHEIQSLLQQKVSNTRLNNISIGKILSSKGYLQKKSMGISKWVFKEKKVIP